MRVNSAQRYYLGLLTSISVSRQCLMKFQWPTWKPKYPRCQHVPWHKLGFTTCKLTGTISQYVGINSGSLIPFPRLKIPLLSESNVSHSDDENLYFAIYIGRAKNRYHAESAGINGPCSSTCSVPFRGTFTAPCYHRMARWLLWRSALPVKEIWRRLAFMTCLGFRTLPSRNRFLNTCFQREVFTGAWLHVTEC